MENLIFIFLIFLFEDSKLDDFLSKIISVLLGFNVFILNFNGVKNETEKVYNIYESSAVFRPKIFTK